MPETAATRDPTAQATSGPVKPLFYKLDPELGPKETPECRQPPGQPTLKTGPAPLTWTA